MRGSFAERSGMLTALKREKGMWRHQRANSINSSWKCQCTFLSSIRIVNVYPVSFTISSNINAAELQILQRNDGSAFQRSSREDITGDRLRDPLLLYEQPGEKENVKRAKLSRSKSLQFITRFYNETTSETTKTRGRGREKRVGWRISDLIAAKMRYTSTRMCYDYWRFAFRSATRFFLYEPIFFCICSLK